ncbi:MAG: sel1 repeat family protein [Vampirovibrionales bacterium]|nr:sel1 repeat family protein [Vampirovibrionales bacterium]
MLVRVKHLYILGSLCLSFHLPVMFALDSGINVSSDAKAFYLTSLMYQKGRQKLPKDVQLAHHYLVLASQSGYRDAQVQLGLDYLNTSKPSHNEVEARYWLEKASQQGDALAQFTLAMLYQEGRGGNTRLREAITLLQASAKQGYLPAYTALGMSYASGKGVSPDLRQAFRYYKFAASHGQKVAQFKLGLMHQTGLGTSRDAVQGLAWLMLAEDGGFRKAKPFREKLEAQSSTEATQKARALKTTLTPSRSKYRKL